MYTMKYLYKRVVASAMVLFVAPIMTSTTFAQDDVIAPTVDIAQSVTTPAAGATEDVTPTPIVAPQEGPSTTDVMQTVEAVSPSADVVETEPTEESATISTALAPIADDTASEA
jgi:hypothetical protein